MVYGFIFSSRTTTKIFANLVVLVIMKVFFSGKFKSEDVIVSNNEDKAQYYSYLYAFLVGYDWIILRPYLTCTGMSYDEMLAEIERRKDAKKSK